MKAVLILVFILGTSASSYGKPCIGGLGEISRDLKISQSLDKFGGISGLLGDYKLGGFLGAIKDLQVGIQVLKEKFFVRLNGEGQKQVLLCKKSSKHAEEHELYLQVLNPKVAENSIFLLRPGSKGRLMVSGERSKWRFMKFKKIQSPRSLKTAELKSQH